MKYFNGFSLKGEEEIFSEFIEDSDFTIVGFSYGAQKAFEYVYNATTRVERLILLSPAFFQTQKNSFIRTQLRYFDSNKDEYIKQFLLNTAYPSDISLDNYLLRGSKDELEELLNYKWDIDRLKEISAKGIKIDVYLGYEDKIINSKEAFDFFKEVATIYYIKEVGHALR